MIRAAPLSPPNPLPLLTSPSSALSLSSLSSSPPLLCHTPLFTHSSYRPPLFSHGLSPASVYPPFPSPAHRSAPHGAPMASPACHKLPTLSRLASDRRALIQSHPHHTTLFPFLPQQDSFPCTNPPHASFLIFPSPSPTNSSFDVRKAFEDVVCDSLPDFPGALHTASTHAACAATPTMDGSAEDSTCNSSISSSDCMSSNSDEDEDDTGSSSTSSQSNFGSPPAQEGPLDSLASLCAALPIKRGLSRHFSGKSQSFSSLARVSSVAELAKPENPYAKRRRTAGLGADSLLKHHSYPPRCSSSAGISKRPATLNRYKSSFKSLPRPERVALEGLAKCFSVPEF